MTTNKTKKAMKSKQLQNHRIAVDEEKRDYRINEDEEKTQDKKVVIFKFRETNSVSVMGGTKQWCL